MQNFNHMYHTAGSLLPAYSCFSHAESSVLASTFTQLSLPIYYNSDVKCKTVINTNMVFANLDMKMLKTGNLPS